MNFNWFALIAFLLGVAALVLFDLLARTRRDDGDRGDYWTFVLSRTVIVLAPALLVSGCLELFPVLFESGWHLLFDLTRGAFGLGPAARYRLAVALPFGVWALVLLVGLVRSPRERESGRWLAGAIGLDSDSRLWVLWCTVPPGLVLLFNFGELGGGPRAYPGATWATLGVVTLSLVGVALSTGGTRIETSDPEAAQPDPASPPGRSTWPDAMAGRGVELESLARWSASPPPAPRKPRDPAAEELAERLGRLGARRIAPELIEAAAGLLKPALADQQDRSARLVFGPDDCGQVEIVALAATLLQQRFQASTLVVTPGETDELAARLSHWTASPDFVQAIGPTGDEPREVPVWVVDAETLSDRLLPKLKEPARVRRVGLVVWWHLERYSGVRAANLWAISRRLHRLIRLRGRHDVRTLAFVRSSAHGGAQANAFVRRILPHPFPDETVVRVEPRFPRPVELYRLAGHKDFFERGDGHNLRDTLRHPVLVAAKVSAEAGWATRPEVPADVAGAGDFFQLDTAGGRLGDLLCPSAARAEVRLREVEAGEVLSLVEIVSQGGRAVDVDGPHHVGIHTSWNPYVDFLLRRLAGGGSDASEESRRGPAGFEASRRLVCAEAHRGIFRRHLLLALNELPESRNGLLRNFLWNEDVIRETLEEISHEGKLTRQEVRFLDESGRLVIDYEYRSQRLPADERRPLDTVGAELVAVRDPAAGFDREEGVKMRVDPERLTIRAYPHGVFLAGGRRYRIREWTSIDEVLERGWLECQREDEVCRTWRIRNHFLFDIEPQGAWAGLGRQGRLLTRMRADLHYEEEVMGAIHLAPDLTTGTLPPPEILHLSPSGGTPHLSPSGGTSHLSPSGGTQRTAALTQSFATRALVLRFPEAAEPVALTSLSQALRHVLPVHLGVEEDALEVVALVGETIDGLETHGLAIVDLYPGGIGLIDAIHDDSSLILQLLEWTRDWLEACPCQSDPGCEECVRSPAALAVNIDQLPLRSAALGLLRRIP